MSVKPFSPKDSDRYLGDGVYASFDGWQIWLAVGHHENRQIALDSDTQAALLDYISKIDELRRTVR